MRRSLPSANSERRGDRRPHNKASPGYRMTVASMRSGSSLRDSTRIVSPPKSSRNIASRSRAGHRSVQILLTSTDGDGSWRCRSSCMHYLLAGSLPRSPSASSVTPKTSSMRHRTLPRIETEWDMATFVIASPVAEKHGIRVREHLFFGTMTVVIALVVFIGFARTYYLAGVFNAKPLAAPIVHLHGAVFTSWIVLLLTQSLLVGTGHTRIHRRLGIMGLVLAPLMVVFGVLVAVEMVKRF